ncbi:hypothetical protein VNO77_24877 [Canavalia gladiata]|uniref:Uncharacterized protein n=1 Tax=Canavalia gladiata TaxID=3824 RepID=A0AAN9QD44_CANGL
MLAFLGWSLYILYLIELRLLICAYGLVLLCFWFKLACLLVMNRLRPILVLLLRCPVLNRRKVYLPDSEFVLQDNLNVIQSFLSSICASNSTGQLLKLTDELVELAVELQHLV